ncbi:DUF1700 domain-containing protein [Clostridium sp. C2-6-12]|uniref:DUF1700 domain-containing protein n=1 Tax=Clostridium sp. C2-6-12 TaxID=2698832 RepID=UPI00137135ED|nr:DUF1700 domain-containing protein [Clostridium sp. C2-6-12]
MNQNEFFNILMDGFKDFPESKLRNIISYYDNKFTQGIAQGKTEEEIAAELGNPNLIVSQYKSEFLDINDISMPFEAENISSIEVKNSNSEPITYESNLNTINDNSFVSGEFLSTDGIINDNDDTTQGNNNFTINDTLDKAQGILLNDDNLNHNKYSKPYEDINSSNGFYDLYTNNQPVKSEDLNYDTNTSSSKTNNYNTVNSSSKNSQSTVNLILKISIIIVTLLIFSPVITGIIGCIIGLFGVAISILVGSIGLLVGGTFTSLVGVPNVPMFVANFPYPVIVLFSLGSISFSLFLTLVFYYLCKFLVKLLVKAYRALKLKGGDL